MTSSGFGEGMVRKFCTEGESVLIADLNMDAAVTLASELGRSAEAVKANVADEAGVISIKDAAIDFMGGMDILVNNVGTTHM